jgi:hypothetical protein
MEAVQHDGRDEAGLAGAAFAVGIAASVGIDLPEACVEGVVANLALLREHAARIDDFALPGDIGIAG